jgi:hypothetical protein
MSEDETKEAIFRLVTRRRELKDRKTLIVSELSAAGDSLCDICASLKHIGNGSQMWLEDILTRVKQAPEICGLARIGGMIAELKETQEALDKLNRSAAELRID